MAITPQSLPRAAREPGAERALRLPFGMNWTALALGAIVLLAAALRFANIGAIGESNTYYTAAVKSMLQSWHNFFFVAAEPGGSVSVDKPPVAFWLQAISAYFLGVNGFAVVLPQILAGIGSVILLFHLVRRSFGNVAGLLAALVLAITPVAIAVERNNTPDATLIFTLLLAAWAFIKATETSKLRFLLIGAALVGVGFNIKMMQAFLPLPAFYALYLFGSEQGWRRKIAHLGLATLVLVPIALSWAIAVDLTPADQRPYVGSSGDNSALNLAIGYNGIQRLFGNGPGGGTARGTDAQQQAQPAAGTGATGQGPADAPAASGQASDGQQLLDGDQPGGFGGVGGAFGTGQAGPLRLFQSGLAAQVSWLLPFGLIALVAMAFSRSWRRPQTALHRGLILWGGWLITCAVFFSVAGFFHQYYLAMLGAPLAAIVAIGVVWLWRLRAAHPLRAALLLLAAAAVTLAFQVYAVQMYGVLAWWVAVPVVLFVAGLTLVLLSLRRAGRALPRLATGLVVAALLVVPGVWSGMTTAYATEQQSPQAYGQSGGFGMRRDDVQPNGAAPMDGNRSVNQNLLTYLLAHTQDTKYLMVVPSAQAGAQYVLATGRPVLYAGGFAGSDPVLDADGLAKLVASGEVRYVLWGGGGPGGGSNSSITSYLQASCTVVSDLSLSTSTGGPGGSSTLYQCDA